MFSAIKRDFLTRKSAYMSRIKKEKVKLMYLVLLKHSTSSTNESAFRKAGYSAIFVKKVQKVKIDEWKLVCNCAKFIKIEEKVALK